MSQLLRYIVVYFLLGMVYSYHLNAEASIVLKVEEQRAIQRRNTAFNYMAKKRKEHPEYSSEDLRTNANRIFIAVSCTSVAFVLFGWSVLMTPLR